MIIFLPWVAAAEGQSEVDNCKGKARKHIKIKCRIKIKFNTFKHFQKQ